MAKKAAVDTEPRKLGLYQSMRGELIARRAVVINQLKALDDIEKRREELNGALEDIDAEIGEYDAAIAPIAPAAG